MQQTQLTGAGVGQGRRTAPARDEGNAVPAEGNRAGTQPAAGEASLQASYRQTTVFSIHISSTVPCPSASMEQRAPLALAAAGAAVACWCRRASGAPTPIGAPPHRRTITFLTAWSGVGKTTTGDYLGTYCGVHHIDGDDDMRRPDDEVRQGATDGLVKSFYEHWFKDKTAPAELWHPYHNLLCDKIVAALSTHRDVVVSFSVYRREVRDFLRERLKSSAEVRFLKLECNADVVVKGALARVKDFRSMQNMTVEDWWGKTGNADTYGAFSFESYKQHQVDTVLSGMEPFVKDELNCIVVDVSSRDASCFRRVTTALKLPPGPDAPDFEMLAALQKARWAKLNELRAQKGKE